MEENISGRVVGRADKKLNVEPLAALTFHGKDSLGSSFHAPESGIAF